jgi:hypothetical protein
MGLCGFVHQQSGAAAQVEGFHMVENPASYVEIANGTGLSIGLLKGVAHPLLENGTDGWSRGQPIQPKWQVRVAPTLLY